MLNESSIIVDRVKLNWATGPEHGPPLLMFHGVLRRWQGFVPLAGALSTRWHVHALDHRGHGKSDRVADRYQVIDYIRDMAAVVSQQFREPVVLYGHSLGAMVAMGVAAAVPELVKAIVLEDPPLDTMGARIAPSALHNYFAAVQTLVPTQDSPLVIARRLTELTYLHPGTGETLTIGKQRDATTLRFMSTCLAQLDPGVLVPIVERRWLEGWNWQQELPKVRCPVLLLQADEIAGGMLIDTDAQQCVDLIPDCTLIKMRGVGHLMHWQRPGEVTNHTLTFLEAIR